MRGPKASTAVILLSMALAGCATPSEDSAVLLSVPADPTITFKVWFDVGSRDDPAGKEGLAYLTGRMIAEGATAENSYEEILAALYPLAASYTVSVDREMTVVSGRTHRDNLDRFFELYEDAFVRPAFNEDDFARIKSNTLNYLEKSLRFAQDEELGKAALYAFVFEGTPYAAPPQGTVASLSALTVDDVKRFYRDHYGAANATPALGGGFDDALVARFDEALGGLPVAKESAKVASPIEPAAIEGRRVVLVNKPGADASISFGFPIDVRRGDRDFYALWVANSWLGEHRNSASHLFQVIREQRGLNYGDYSYIEAFPGGGRRSFPPTHVGRERQIFEVWIRTLPNDQAQFALRAAMRELQRLVDHGMTEEQFEQTRQFLRKYVLHFAQTTETRLGYAVDDRFYGVDGSGHLERFRSTMDELTLDEVNAAIRKHLGYENVKIAIVTGEVDGLQAALVEDRASPIEYASEKPESVIQEDAQIAKLPLGIGADDIRVVPVEAIFENGSVLGGAS